MLLSGWGDFVNKRFVYVTENSYYYNANFSFREDWKPVETGSNENLELKRYQPS